MGQNGSGKVASVAAEPFHHEYHAERLGASSAPIADELRSLAAQPRPDAKVAEPVANRVPLAVNTVTQYIYDLVRALLAAAWKHFSDLAELVAEGGAVTRTSQVASADEKQNVPYFFLCGTDTVRSPIKISRRAQATHFPSQISHFSAK
jgi:hypothetical protein